MSAKDLRQFAAIVFVAWAAAWGAVYWVSAGRAAKAHEAGYWMSASMSAAARAAADNSSACQSGGPCLGRPYDARVRQYLLDHGMSPQLRANQQAYLRNFGQVEAQARQWQVRAAWWGLGGLVLIVLAAVGAQWRLRGLRPNQ